MRHAVSSQRLSRPSEHRQALVQGLVKSLVVHGQIRTTLARAKTAQRLADRLVTFGKEGSIHARRQAYRVLQDETLVKRLFGDIAPRFIDANGGYTRVMRLERRCGDGARQALLTFSRLPAVQPAAPTGPRPAQAPTPAPTAPGRPQPEKPAAAEKPKGLFEGLRTLWTKKKKGRVAA